MFDALAYSTDAFSVDAFDLDDSALNEGSFSVDAFDIGAFDVESFSLGASGPPPEPVAPVAEFSATPLIGNAPLFTTFTNASSEADSYEWDFGDSTTSTLENPTKTYIAIGTFDVTLTATGPNGVDSETKFLYIRANNPNPPTSGEYRRRALLPGPRRRPASFRDRLA